jgi:hypothetical protein
MSDIKAIGNKALPHFVRHLVMFILPKTNERR